MDARADAEYRGGHAKDSFGWEHEKGMEEETLPLVKNSCAFPRGMTSAGWPL